MQLDRRWGNDMRGRPGKREEWGWLRSLAGKRLRDRRIAAGLTQRDLADALGFRYHTRVAQYESGQAALPSEYLKPYADALGCDLRELAKELLLFYEPHIFRHLYRQEFEAMKGPLGLQWVEETSDGC